jgi:hypothetical protein
VNRLKGIVEDLCQPPRSPTGTQTGARNYLLDIDWLSHDHT